jgi:hypothetical protein
MPEIKIACTGAGFEDYRNLVDLQGNLKDRTEEDIKTVAMFILKDGWSFPFFVWKDGETKYVLDGHGRIKALEKLENQGVVIPSLPAAYIFAENEKEAKIKLLKLNSRCGSLTESGYALFTSDMNHIDLDGVSIYFDVPEKVTVDTADYAENLESVDGFSEVGVGITCPSCIEESSFTVKELLDSMGE